MPAAKEETAENNKSLIQLKRGPISGIIMLYYKLMHFPSVLVTCSDCCGSNVAGEHRSHPENV